MKLIDVDKDSIEIVIYRYTVLDNGEIISGKFEDNTWHLSDEQILSRIKEDRKVGN